VVVVLAVLFTNGQDGGSGGGQGTYSSASGTAPYYGIGTTGQGNDGGALLSGSSSGGGGGANSVGGTGTSGGGGNGGTGSSSSITGTATFYAGGGGGGTWGGVPGGTGGSSIGGNAGTNAQAGTAGATNTGSGGGGASISSGWGSQGQLGGTGADGIVIVRYVDDGSITATGGTVTTTSTQSPIIIINANGLTDNTSTPHHYAFTRSGNSWAIYHDGVYKATATDTTSLGSSSMTAPWDSASAVGFTINGATVTPTHTVIGSNNWIRTVDTFSTSSGASLSYNLGGTSSPNTNQIVAFSKETSAPSGGGYSEMDFALYTDGSGLMVIENNVAYGNWQVLGSWTLSDTFGIDISSSGVVTYKKNGVTFHTS